MNKEIIVFGLIGVVLIGCAAYGTYNNFGLWVSFVGLMGVVSFCLSVKLHAEQYQHVGTFPIERRKRFTRLPKHKERRSYY